MPRPVSKWFNFKGERLSIPEISRRTGLSEPALRERASKGMPLDAPFGRRVGRLPFGDEMLTRKQIAIELGIHPNVVSDRLKRGKPLTDRRYAHAQQ